MSTGIYGRILLHLERRGRPLAREDSESKTMKFTPGDIVGVFESHALDLKYLFL